MSLILGLDTSTRHGALALVDLRSGQCWTDDQIATQNHGRELVPAIGRLVAAAGRHMADLGGIVVGVGPGSYTGLRVGIAVAKTLAEVLSVPVVPLDSLLLPVLAAPDDSTGTILSIADAQRGAVAVSVYCHDSPTGEWGRSNGPEILAWQELKRWSASPAPVLITGPGLELTARLGPAGLRETPRETWYPASNVLARWMLSQYSGQSPVSADTLEPLYLRPSAAEEKRAATHHPAAG